MNRGPGARFGEGYVSPWAEEIGSMLEPTAWSDDERESGGAEIDGTMSFIYLRELWCQPSNGHRKPW